MALTKVIGSGIGTVTNQFADGNMSAGSVIQVVQGTLVTGDSSTSTSYNATGLQVQITPSSTSSKILITAIFYAGFPSQNNQTRFTIYKDSTNLDLSGSQAGGFTAIGDSTGDGNMTYQGQGLSCQYLDSPSSTSQLTYKLMRKQDGGTGYFNVNQNGDASAKRTCVMIAQEIGA